MFKIVELSIMSPCHQYNWKLSTACYYGFLFSFQILFYQQLITFSLFLSYKVLLCPIFLTDCRINNKLYEESIQSESQQVPLSFMHCFSVCEGYSFTYQMATVEGVYLCVYCITTPRLSCFRKVWSVELLIYILNNAIDLGAREQLDPFEHTYAATYI